MFFKWLATKAYVFGLALTLPTALYYAVLRSDPLATACLVLAALLLTVLWLEWRATIKSL